MITSTSFGGDDRAEVDVEAVREEHRRAGPERGEDRAVPELDLDVVGHEDADDVGADDGVGRALRLPAVRLGARPALGPGRMPMTTSQPDSFRFSAWAWPCEP